jgi:hypothetical protein
MSLLLECGALYCIVWVRPHTFACSLSLTQIWYQVLFIAACVSDKGALVLGGREDVLDQVSDHIVTQLTVSLVVEMCVPGDLALSERLD